MTISLFTSIYLISIVSVLLLIGVGLLLKDLFTTIRYNRTMKQVRERWNKEHGVK